MPLDSKQKIKSIFVDIRQEINRVGVNSRLRSNIVVLTVDSQSIQWL